MQSSDAPLYLHFLDRELNNSLNLTLHPRVTSSVIKALLLGTNSFLYCGLSLLWESPSIDSDLRWILGLLIKYHFLDTISHHTSVSEFIDSRQRLYSHVPGRYPMYFEEKDTQYEKLVPTDYKPIGTTQSLESRLKKWRLEAEIDFPTKRILHQSLKETLRTREGRAITIDLFQKNMDQVQNGEYVQGIIRRKISLDYTRHYLEYGKGDIVTGIYGFSYFDQIAAHFPYFDMPILEMIFNAFGLNGVINNNGNINKLFWEQAIIQRLSKEHLIVRKKIKALITLIYNQAIRDLGKESSLFSLRGYLQRNLAPYITAIKNGEPYRDQEIYSFMMNKINQIPQLAHLDGFELNQIDILLMTAVPVETNAVKDLIAGKYKKSIRPIPPDLTENAYYDLGEINGQRIYLTESSKGSTGPNSSTLTAYDGIYEFRPKAIILLGIAFGVDNVKQKIGDILLSDYVLPYEKVRIGTDELGQEELKQFGEKVPSTPRLFNSFKTIGGMWDKAEIIPGVILSGEKLVDNIDYRDNIRDLDKDAVGGEMEGVGLYSACYRKGVKWLIAKAICDWADGEKKINKQKRQQKAAAMVAEFVLEVIEKGGVS